MPPRTIAIVQSNYIPWKGYFDLIQRADTFVLFEEVQYTKRDWRYRNRIKTESGPRWLSIPIDVKGRYHQSIREARISDPAWAADHWRVLERAYRDADHFAWAAERLGPLYAGPHSLELSVSNRHFLEAICGWLGIDTPLRWSWELPGGGEDADATDRLLAICLGLDAECYLSGPAAKSYLDVARFEAAGVSVAWMDYGCYPRYPQPHGDFVHEMSVVDLLFCTGEGAPAYLRQQP
jgi:hypothetical protein